MEKIEFKGKVFKGSEGEFLLSPSSNGGIILDAQSGQPLQVLNVSDAKLWANSKNLLKAAIEAHKIISGMASLCQSKYDYDSVQEDLNKLETEILKSL